MIDSDDILYDEIKVVDVERPELKYHNMYIFLTSIEKAVAQLLNEGIDINAGNVSPYLEPKQIKAPAITLALQKNKKKIAYLLVRYRNKWPNAIKYFKPLINAVRNEPGVFEDIDMAN